MVNRYITALLVVLAATGGEGIGGGHSLRAQSHQSGIRR